MKYEDFDPGEALCFGCASKSDPYGANIPSPLGEGGRGGGEVVPAHGLPDRYPAYLKPIPINTRNIEKELRKYLKAEEPHLRRVLYSTWNANAQDVKYQEIRNAIRDGEFSEGFLEKFKEQRIDMINNELTPTWEAAMDKSATFMGRQVERQFGEFQRFNAGSDRVRNWLSTRGGELAVNMGKDEHRALRSTLNYYTTERAVGPHELGRIIRAQIGLTDKQAQAVNRVRETLLMAGELSPKDVEHQAQNYAARLHRIRAERIARTEISFAFNQGALEQMRQMNGPKGVLEGEQIIKRFYVSQDERTCEYCGPLHNQIVELEETFPGATRRLPNVTAPPIHPNCRCTIIYEVLRVQV